MVNMTKKGSNVLNEFDWMVVASYIVVTLFAAMCLLPFYYIIVVSFSNPRLINSSELIMWPHGLSLEAYRVTLSQKKFFTSFGVSVQRTVFGTALSLLVVSMLSYAISRKYLRGRKFFFIMILFTMLFSGGMIPTYLVVRYTRIMNTIWALIIPGLVNTFNVIVLTNFFAAIPDEIEESARLDGANDIVIFLKLIVPISLPALATITLFIAVAHWNSLMDGIIYINKTSLKPLQVYLTDIVMKSLMEDFFQDSADRAIPPLTLQCATIFASTIPILVVYPFLQRFFVKGVMVGAVKG